MAMKYIALVGRPNVGKSTLFNKIVGGRPAIVDNTPGVTRDRNLSSATRWGKKFCVIDSGGFEPDSTELIPALTREQSLMAIEEANVIFFVVDGQSGPTPEDKEIARSLRRANKPIFLVVNKIDSQGRADEIYTFSELGFNETRAISAEHSLGVEELLEEVLADVEPEPESDEEEMVDRPIRIAIVGKPNVGKSSIVNRILGTGRMMVSDIAGTTRDAIDSLITRNGKEYVLVDTAGIRRKSKVSEKLEKFSVIMAMKAVERADIALLVIDATEGIATQEAKIAGLIEEENAACIILVNKWDAVEKETMTSVEYERAIRDKLKFLPYAPMLFISAKNGQRVEKIFDEVEEVYTQFSSRINTAALNEMATQIVTKKEPPIHKGRRIKFYFATQNRTCPPSFIFMTSQPDALHFSYRRYVLNRLREMTGFDKTPIRITFTKPSNRRPKPETSIIRG
jgi:GTP-binding protein